MRKVKILFIVQLLVLTVMTVSSCEYLGLSGTGTTSECKDSGNKDTSNPIANSTSTAQNDTVKKESPNVILAEAFQNKQNEQDSIITRINEKVQSLESKSTRLIDSSTVYALMLFELLILLLVFFFLYRRMSILKHKVKVSYDDNSHKESGVPQSVRLFFKTEKGYLMKDINQKIQSQDGKIDDHEKRLKKLEPHTNPYSGYYSGNKRDDNNQTKTVVNESGEPNSKPSNSNVFFMPRTMTPLQFEDSKKKYTKSDNTYFKFVIMRDNIALFSFEPYDDTCFKKAFDDRDNSLSTVCDIEIINTQPRNFKIVEQGKAELINGIWKVTQKMKLQYV